MSEPAPLRVGGTTIRVIVVAELRLYHEGLAPQG